MMAGGNQCVGVAMMAGEADHWCASLSTPPKLLPMSPPDLRVKCGSECMCASRIHALTATCCYRTSRRRPPRATTRRDGCGSSPA